MDKIEDGQQVPTSCRKPQLRCYTFAVFYFESVKLLLQMCVTLLHFSDLSLHFCYFLVAFIAPAIKKENKAELLSTHKEDLATYVVHFLEGGGEEKDI